MEEKTDLLKKAAGEKAAEYIEDGMVVGLGSGSTVCWMVKKLGERVEQGLNIKGIPTSLQTEGWAKEFQIPLTNFSEVHYVDIAIDGTDEIDPGFNMIKGGGGALVREKIVASSAKKLIIIADESKVVDELGKFPLPVEVLPFGWQLIRLRNLEQNRSCGKKTAVHLFQIMETIFLIVASSPSRILDTFIKT